MLFRVRKEKTLQYNQTDTIYLTPDNWNDWHQYWTLFAVEYLDSNGKRHFLENLKIGRIDAPDGSDRTTLFSTETYLPIDFSELDENFFSIGQSEEYYEKIKEFGDDKRKEILIALRDIAYDKEIYKQVEDLRITYDSLLRSISKSRVEGQFRRIAHGGIKLTNYEFEYQLSNTSEGLNSTLSFKVNPESSLPTNIHVIIGRNGVGKTYLLKNIISSIFNEKETASFSDINHNLMQFANILCISFSSFDDFEKSSTEGKMPYVFIGLNDILFEEGDKEEKNRTVNIKKQFKKSLGECFSNKAKKDSWIEMMSILKTDPIFCEYSIEEVSTTGAITDMFSSMSSGHKIILFSLTLLVEKLEEGTLVLIDEPETHLHPPLLSTYVRAISNLLALRNGLAIIATHSPVVLQEVPRGCVWRLSRVRDFSNAERIEKETFGENVGILTNEVFGLEVKKSGFYTLLEEAVAEYNGDYEAILNKFDWSLGNEARYILRSLTEDYSRGESINE